jgi:hypothetical protein
MVLVNETYILPDPFKFIDGQRTKTKADWACRAEQVRALLQEYELGYKPTRPELLTSTFASDTLNITAGIGNNKIQFSLPITYPTTGKAPYPVVIAYDGLSVPVPSGVAVITFANSDMGQQNDQSSRGIGQFYDLYGPNATAGAMMAWAWGTSRIIDVLESSPELLIDTSRIAVTGCSRDGKGALVAGAFDERIALTIPQESGSGGDACWRTSRAMLVDRNLLTQTATEIIQENVWFSLSFDPFGATNYTISLLPFDHHTLAGLIAPRGLYSTENVEFLWLGDWSNYQCMTTANKIFQALGVPHNQGFSQDGPHDHCAFPADQELEIAAFYDKFLLGQDADTSVFRTVGNWSYNATWVPWSAPQLI